MPLPSRGFPGQFCGVRRGPAGTAGRSTATLRRGTAEPWRLLPQHLTCQHRAGGHGNAGGICIAALRAPRGVKGVKACEGNSLPYHSHYSPTVSITCRTVKAVKAFPKRI
jgi:hypothetical protein